MWEERSRHDWQQTSALQASILNASRGKDQQAVQPADLDPWTRIDARRNRARKGAGWVDELTRAWVPDDGEEGRA